MKWNFQSWALKVQPSQRRKTWNIKYFNWSTTFTVSWLQWISPAPLSLSHFFLSLIFLFWAPHTLISKNSHDVLLRLSKLPMDGARDAQATEFQTNVNYPNNITEVSILNRSWDHLSIKAKMKSFLTHQLLNWMIWIVQTCWQLINHHINYLHHLSIDCQQVVDVKKLLCSIEANNH